jgi:hypothetical protein
MKDNNNLRQVYLPSGRQRYWLRFSEQTESPDDVARALNKKDEKRDIIFFLSEQL